MHLLELIGVTKRFGGLVAINKIDMKVKEVFENDLKEF